MISDCEKQSLEGVVRAALGCRAVSLVPHDVQGIGGTAFRGLVDGSQRVFVKVGTLAFIHRSFRVHQVCHDLPFVPKVLHAQELEWEGKGVLCTTFLAGERVEYYDEMTPTRVKALAEGYRQFSARIQALKDDSLHDALMGDARQHVAVLRAYVQTHAIGRWLLRDLLADQAAIPVPDPAGFGVIHNDFNINNYAFAGDHLAAIYDYDILARGFPCEDLVLVPAIRCRAGGVALWRRARLRQRFKELVLSAGWPIAEWRYAVNMHRIRWAAEMVQERPNSIRYLFKIRREDRRLRLMMRVLDEVERERAVP